MALSRLQKILARAGITSRRKAETLIASGRVRVDGRVVSELGAKADPRRSAIELDGRRLHAEPLCYGIFHKPRGMVTTMSDPEGRPTALDVLRQVGVRVVPVGRLDFNTSGALLFTNDGDFAQAIQHARGGAEKVYVAKVTRPVDEQNLERWAESIDIEGKKTRPAAVRILRREAQKCWLEITVTEGKNRQVRRLGEHAGTPVDRLSRLSHAGISTEGLRPGKWRLLSTDELKDLKKRYGVPEKIRGAIAPTSLSPPAARGSRTAVKGSKGPAASSRDTEKKGRRPARSAAKTSARSASPRSVSPPKEGRSQRPKSSAARSSNRSRTR